MNDVLTAFGIIIGAYFFTSYIYLWLVLDSMREKIDTLTKEVEHLKSLMPQARLQFAEEEREFWKKRGGGLSGVIEWMRERC